MAQARRVLQIMQRLSPEERAALSQVTPSFSTSSAFNKTDRNWMVA